jgi:hypothetical protein
MMTEQTEEPQNVCSEQFRKVFNTFDKDGNGLITERIQKSNGWVRKKIVGKES